MLSGPSQAEPSPGGAGTAAAATPKVLRYAFPQAETGFDPAQVSDVYSRYITSNVFDALYSYDYLARPAKLRPETAADMPEVADDFRTFTIRLKPGIYFADDAAFKGQRRELIAADYVYSLKRHYDPKTRSQSLAMLDVAPIVGLQALRDAALKGQPFDYDREVEGLKALDRYTLQIRLEKPSPRYAYVLADSAMVAMAREVVEHYGDNIMEHPVGTGPFRLTQWVRSSRMVLERNPGYREVHYESDAPADDARSQAIAGKLRGRRLPMLDRVEVAIVSEAQPRWLGFLNAEQDMIERLPSDFAPIAAPNGELAPNLTKRGVQMDRVFAGDVTYSYFAMNDPVVGGYTPDKVALRRAISLGYDVEAELVRVRRGDAVPSQGVVPPTSSSYDPGLHTEMSEYDPARAQALLDVYGYVDHDGDGWRDQPDGSPLAIEMATQPEQASRQLDELWQKTFDRLRIRHSFRTAKWPENLKASRNGKLMMWGVAWIGATPDPSYFLDLMYGPQAGQTNKERFELPEYDALYRRQAVMPDGPERDAIIREMQLIGVAYMPMKLTSHRYATDLTHPWVIGYRRHPFNRGWWRYVDVDMDARAEALE